MIKTTRHHIEMTQLDSKGNQYILYPKNTLDDVKMTSKSGESIRGKIIFYGVCDTSATEKGKVVDGVEGFTLTSGQHITVAFTNEISVDGVSLNVNSLGAKPLYRNGAPLEANIIPAGTNVELVYDGENFNIVGGTSIDASDIKTGILSSDRLETSGVTAGTYGPNKNSSLYSRATFLVPKITVDEYGRIVSSENIKFTFPPITDSNVSTETESTEIFYIAGTTDKEGETGTLKIHPDIYIDSKWSLLTAKNMYVRNTLEFGLDGSDNDDYMEGSISASQYTGNANTSSRTGSITDHIVDSCDFDDAYGRSEKALSANQGYYLLNKLDTTFSNLDDRIDTVKDTVSDLESNYGNLDTSVNEISDGLYKSEELIPNLISIAGIYPKAYLSENSSYTDYKHVYNNLFGLSHLMMYDYPEYFNLETYSGLVIGEKGSSISITLPIDYDEDTEYISSIRKSSDTNTSYSPFTNKLVHIIESGNAKFASYINTEKSGLYQDDIVNSINSDLEDNQITFDIELKENSGIALGYFCYYIYRQNSNVYPYPLMVNQWFVILSV